MENDTKLTIADGRKAELDGKIVELRKRHLSCFNRELRNDELLEVLSEMFEDDRKNFIKRSIGTVTYADHDYLAQKFRDQEVLERVAKEMKDAEGETEVKSGGDLKGASRKSNRPNGGSKKSGSVEALEVQV